MRREMLMSQNSHDPHRGRERWTALVSRVLLVASLIWLACTNAVHAARNTWLHFYYDHLYARLRGVHRAADALRHSRVQLWSMIVTIVLLVPMISFMRVGVAVTVDGRVLGYAESESEVAQACRTLEQSSSKVLGQPFNLDADISYTVAVAPQTSFLSAEELPEVIAQNVDSLATLAVVTVDGESVGATADAAQAQQILQELKAEYAQDDPAASVQFLQDVKVETMQAPTELLLDESTLLNKLSSTTLQEQTYTVDEDDTMTSIAQSQGMKVSELQALNPNVVPERMAPGLKLTVKAATPVISVQVTRKVSYTENIPYTTITRKNANLGRGKTQVAQQGSAGAAAVTAQVVTVNGDETDRTIISRAVTKQPVNKIVEVGTKNLGIGTGNLISPIANGTITSGYKWRWGRFHKGIDYGTSTGTKVRAADNGKVIVSGYSTGGYGYYIIIDHGNGMKTLYGHNSQLLVDVGDVVEQGQTIARSGNTGNSTGPHCHFEVLINDANVNPANYV